MTIRCIMMANGQPLFYEDQGDGKMHEPALVFLYANDQGQQNVTFQHLLAFSSEGSCDRVNSQLTLVDYEVSEGPMKSAFQAYIESQRERRSGIVRPGSAQGQQIMGIVKGGKK